MKWLFVLLAVFVPSVFAADPLPVDPIEWMSSLSGGSKFSTAESAASYICTEGLIVPPNYPECGAPGSSLISPGSCTSSLCGGSNYNLGQSYWVAQCSNTGSSCETVSGGRIYWEPACPAGYNLSATLPYVCTPSACVDLQGRAFETDFSVEVSAASENAYWIGVAFTGEKVCHSDCRASIVRAACSGVSDTKADCSATVNYDTPGTSCETSDRTATVISNLRTATADSGGTSGGGVGVQSASAGFLGEAGATNLARTATNTARIADILSGMSSGTAGGSSGAGAGPTAEEIASESVEAGVGIEEGAGASVAGAGLGNNIEAQKSLMQQTYDNVLALLDFSQAPTMQASGAGTEAGRWKFGLGIFTGGFVNTTCSHTWVVTLPNMSPQAWTLDICSKGLYFRAFLFWAFGIWTAWALWSTIYGHARGQY